jgi:hypothetical protein
MCPKENLVSAQFAGPRPWYWLFRTRNEMEENLDCLVTTYADPDGNSSSVTLQVYDKL